MKLTKKKRRLLICGGLILAAAAGAWMLQKGIIWFNMPPRYQYPVRGVDASHYQGQIDWERIAEQDITFTFIKATEGSGMVDECFAANWENARAAGLYVGAYHFFSFDSAADTQADNFCQVVPNEEDALPPVIDLEYYRSGDLPEKEEVQESLRVMLERLRSEYGKIPIIYTTNKYWKEYLSDFDQAEYTLWIRSIFTPPLQNYSPQWTFWQYNSRGKLEGYSGGDEMIDFNVFRGSRDDFTKYADKRDPS